MKTGGFRAAGLLLDELKKEVTAADTEHHGMILCVRRG